MPETTTPEVRIFCICGQKMKVTETMFGRPGKCIACRQKIRIPRVDELPEAGGAIYLKDHPELLRKPKHKTKSAEELADAVEEADDLPLGDSDDYSESVPLDVLEALQRLWSFDQKIRRQLEKVRSPKKGSPEASEKATLLGYRTLVRNARNDLEEQCRKLAGETTDEIHAIREKLTRANMAVRVGEINYATYLDTINTLRLDRDHLTRRRQNLLGWLAVTDVAMAGGAIDIKLDDIPVKAPPLTLPHSPRSSAPILDQRLEDLRSALREREQAERASAEWDRMGREGVLSKEELRDNKLEAEAMGLRARAAIGYSRGRLEQLAQDFEGDTKAVKAHLELLRSRLRTGELDKSAFQAQEVELLRAQSDNTRARQLAREAMKATSVVEVPAARSTFARRLAAPARDFRGIGFDSFIAWAASGLLVLNIVVPITKTQIGGNMVVMPVLAAGMFVVAVLLAMVAVLSDRRVRGLLMSGLWFTGCVGASFLLHSAWYRIDPVGISMRMNPDWFLTPGILLLAICSLLMGLAASIALGGVQGYRWAPAVVAALTVTAMASIFTDAGGLLSARAHVAQPLVTPTEDSDAPYSVVLNVTNTGLRTLWLEARRSAEVPTPVEFLLERRIGNDSWEEATGIQQMKREGDGWVDAQGSLRRVALGGGYSLALRYALDAGTYRVSTTTYGRGEPQREESLFTLDALPEPEVEAGTETEESSIPAEPVTGTENPDTLVTPEIPIEETPVANSAEVTLQGVANAAGQQPKFLVSVRFPDGTVEKSRISVGDSIAGAWTAAEFRATSQSLVISDGNETLLLRSGNSFLLPLDLPVENDDLAP